LAGLVLLALGLWLYEATRVATGLWRGIGRAGAGVSLILAVALVLVSPAHTRSTEGPRGSGLPWEPYTADRLAELRAGGTPVFMNVTAAWCITCLVNERVALQSPQVAAKLAEKRVASVKADWTNRDPAISQVLESFQRSGVPLYVLFPGATPGGSGNAPPRVLPQILTEGMVLEALERL